MLRFIIVYEQYCFNLPDPMYRLEKYSTINYYLSRTIIPDGVPYWDLMLNNVVKSNRNEYFFTEDEAKTAGLLSNGVYTKYLKDMLFHKAKWRAMNTEYASALKGLESAENMQYEKMAEKESPVDRMNKRLGLTTEALNDDQ